RVDEARAALVDEDARALVAREALVADRRPVGGVLGQAAGADAELRHLEPVVALLAGRDEPVHHVQVLAPVVVQVAELRTPGPPAAGPPPARRARWSPAPRGRRAKRRAPRRR